ncbi:hypothetical protein Tco_0184412 [Tanacetum coccineum]
MTLTNHCVDGFKHHFQVREILFLYCYAFSVSLLLTPLCCDDIHDVTPRVSVLAGCDSKSPVPNAICSKAEDLEELVKASDDTEAQ